jgi:ADP-ribose pyrophosphatase YjhB (NUDIX family)
MTRAVTLGAQVMVIDQDRRVLMVRHGYRPGWHFPGGGVDRGESLVDAAVRELREETGVTAIEPPTLFGIYTNFAAFPGDHVAVFTLTRFDRGTPPAASVEIAEQGCFPIDQLPAGTTAGTRARLDEWDGRRQRSVTWV